MTSHDHTHHAPTPKTEPMAIDPVCGMSVNILTSKLHSEYRGTTYHFCGPGCRTKFIATPTKYLDKLRQPNPCPKAPSSLAPCIPK